MLGFGMESTRARSAGRGWASTVDKLRILYCRGQGFSRPHLVIWRSARVIQLRRLFVRESPLRNVQPQAAKAAGRGNTKKMSEPLCHKARTANGRARPRGWRATPPQGTFGGRRIWIPVKYCSRPSACLKETLAGTGRGPAALASAG